MYTTMMIFLLSENFPSDVNLFFYRSILKKLHAKVIAPKNNAAFRAVCRPTYEQYFDAVFTSSRLHKTMTPVSSSELNHIRSCTQNLYVLKIL